MPYMIETWDKPGSEALRADTRNEHLRYLDANKHRLLACGAKLADDSELATGGLYILDTEDPAEARSFIGDDPFTRAGLFERTEVIRWRKAFFNFERLVPPTP